VVLQHRDRDPPAGAFQAGDLVHAAARRVPAALEEDPPARPRRRRDPPALLAGDAAQQAARIAPEAGRDEALLIEEEARLSAAVIIVAPQIPDGVNCVMPALRASWRSPPCPTSPKIADAATAKVLIGACATAATGA
jgi:hypothetical protein